MSDVKQICSLYQIFATMLFHFVGLKDISEKNYPLDVLIQADDTTIVKDFLSEQKIITLGLEIYNGDPQDF